MSITVSAIILHDILGYRSSEERAKNVLNIVIFFAVSRKIEGQYPMLLCYGEKYKVSKTARELGLLCGEIIKRPAG